MGQAPFCYLVSRAEGQKSINFWSRNAVSVCKGNASVSGEPDAVAINFETVVSFDPNYSYTSYTPRRSIPSIISARRASYALIFPVVS
jgi:hypothetical protein